MNSVYCHVCLSTFVPVNVKILPFIAYVFVIFDIETVFIFPWAVILKGAGPFVLVEMVIFLAILVVGLAYAWGKRDLEWITLPTRWQ